MIKQIAVPLTKDEVMMIKSKGSVASPQRTPAGAFVAFTIDAITYFGLKVDYTPQGGATEHLVAVLYPLDANTKHQPSLIRESVLSDTPLYTIPDASIVLPTAPHELRVGLGEFISEAGTLFLDESQHLLLVVRNLDRKVPVEVESGKLWIDSPRPSVTFTKWSVVVPGLEKPEVLFTMLSSRTK
jgi:hypothetical protein